MRFPLNCINCLFDCLPHPCMGGEPIIRGIRAKNNHLLPPLGSAAWLVQELGGVRGFTSPS